mgnify:CR=1 FL=1
MCIRDSNGGGHQNAAGGKSMDSLADTIAKFESLLKQYESCLLYTSPSPRDRTRYRMPSSA